MATTTGIAVGTEEEVVEEIPSTTTKTFTPIAATITRETHKDRRDRPPDRVAATLAKRGATLPRPHMQVRVAGQAPRDPQCAHTTLPARGLIGRGQPVRPNRHFPRRAPCLQAQGWEEGRPSQGGVRRPEGEARGKVAL